MQKVKITPNGVWLNDHELKRILSADIKNISPAEPMELVLRIEVDQADIQYGVRTVSDFTEPIHDKDYLASALRAAVSKSAY